MMITERVPLATRRRIYLSPPHLGEYELQFLEEALWSNWIAPVGPHVDAFEQEMADYVGVPGAVALNSGTAALHLALRLVGVEPGDSVFCSTFTFVASANPILYQGANPVFIDSDPQNWNMSAAALERAFEEAARSDTLPRAVIIVNLYGQSADMVALGEICDSYHVPMIEDAAESLGATYCGKASGSWGRFGIYSFNGNKIITTSGGGMLVSRDLAALETARYWAMQARDPARHYQHSQVGYNYRMSNILAAIGRGQLRVLPHRVEARRAVFNRYEGAFAGMDGIEFMPEASYGRTNRWLSVLTIDPKGCGVTPGEIMDALAEQEIESRPVCKPLHLQPLFQGRLFYPHHDRQNVSEDLFRKGICLPSGSNLGEEDQDRVIQVVKKCVGHSSRQNSFYQVKRSA